MLEELTYESATRMKLLQRYGWLLLLGGCGFVGQPAMQLERGVLDLRDWRFERDGVVEIVGDAEFYWQKLLTPRDFNSNLDNDNRRSDSEHSDIAPDVPVSDGYVRIPRAWNGVTLNGQILNGDGYGTYRFTVLLNRSIDDLAFNIPEVDSAYVLYINGRRVASNGTIGVRPGETEPEWLPQLVILDGEAEQLEVLLQVSNFEHQRGGAGQLLRLGTEAQIVGNYRANLALRLFILGGALIMGFYHLAFFWLRRDDASSIIFSAICFLISLRIVASPSGNMFMHQVLPELNWQLLVKLNYLSFYLLPPVLAMFLEVLFPKEMPSWLVRVLQGLIALYAGIVIFTHTRVFTHTLLSYQLLTLLVGGCSVYVLMRAVQHRRDGALTFFISSLLLFGTVVNDILYSNQLIYTGYALPFGVFAFICSQAFVLLRRFARAFSEVESLTKTLEQRVSKRTEQLVASNRRLLESNTVLQDEIAERKRIGEALNDARLAAERANEAKSNFIARMSHELRTPLTAVLGYAQLLKLDDNLNEEQYEGLDIIEQSGDHLLTLINDVLDMAAIEAGKLSVNNQDVELEVFLQRISNIIRIRAEQKGVSFIFEAYDFAHKTATSRLPKAVRGDPKLIRQVLINLLGNAVKFTDEGSIIFRVGVVGDNRFRFEIQDSGIGIAEDAIDSIFQPFQQVSDSHRQAEGTGLGLAISHNLIELMGGNLTVESRLGEGSIFHFELDLPIISSWRAAIPSSEQRIVGIEGKPPTLLLVDDNDLNRAVLSTLLRPLGFHIVEARDGQQGLERASEHDLDAIITDLMMPAMDGFEMTQAIRADTRWQHLPVIATSASVFNEDRERSMQAGCDDFLAKPIKPKVLFLMLERYLNITWRYTTIPAKSDKRLANNTDATQTNHPQTNHPQTNHSQQATSVPNDAALRRDDTDLEPDHINQDNVPNNDDGSANTDSTRTIN